MTFESAKVLIFIGKSTVYNNKKHQIRSESGALKNYVDIFNYFFFVMPSPIILMAQRNPMSLLDLF
jgi:hypothetical protein